MTIRGATKLARDIVRKTNELNNLISKAAETGLATQIKTESIESDIGESAPCVVFASISFWRQHRIVDYQAPSTW